jgi:hypothetical protein
MASVHLPARNSTTREDSMASSGKKKTTMAKLSRESRLRERRMEKKARKDARRRAAEDPSGQSDVLTDADGFVLGDTLIHGEFVTADGSRVDATAPAAKDTPEGAQADGGEAPAPEARDDDDAPAAQDAPAASDETSPASDAPAGDKPARGSDARAVSTR